MNVATATDDGRKLEQLRGWGWAHALDLICRGLADDARVCEAEEWPETAVSLRVSADQVGRMADVVRRRLATAEALDRASGCE